MTKAHSQTSIAVWTTYDEKDRIKVAAKERGISMTRFLLSLFHKYEEEQNK